MKVNIQEQIDISDEQRLQLAQVLYGGRAKPGEATRQDIKDFVWSHGMHWAHELREVWSLKFSEDEPDEDLVGEPDEDEDLLGDLGSEPDEDEDLIG